MQGFHDVEVHLVFKKHILSVLLIIELRLHGFGMDIGALLFLRAGQIKRLKLD